jgi:ubiquinol-cytochrome c reductase cytochrome b subunit
MLFAITDHGMYRVYLHHIISFDLLFLFLAWDHLRRYKANISGQLLFIIVLVLFSLFIAAPMEPDKLGVSYITGPWFFLGLQELLRYIPPFIAGILVPAALIAGLLLLRRDYSWYKSLMMFVCGWLGCYALLTILALTAHG